VGGGPEWKVASDLKTFSLARLSLNGPKGNDEANYRGITPQTLGAAARERKVSNKLAPGHEVREDPVWNRF